MKRREFLTTSAAKLIVGGAMLQPLSKVLAQAITKVPSESGQYGFVRDSNHWLNWTGNVRMKGNQIVRPTDLAGLQKTVKNASKIRAVGSGHSISTIAYTDDVLMNTEAINQILHINKKDKIVKVMGGMKLRDFNEHMANNGLCIPSTGDTTYQSLAGLMSTGTHGTGMKWGSCSDEHSLLSMELVRPDGTIVTADKELLEAARVGLGSFGVTYSVTMQLDDLHNLEHVGRKSTIEEAWNPKNWLENDHYEFAYFPYTDLCYQFIRNRTDLPADSNRLETWFNEVFLANDLGRVLMEATSAKPSTLPTVLKTFARLYPESREVDRADKIMTTPRKTPAFLMEFALPIKNGPAALEAFRRLVDEFSKKEGPDKFYVNLPTQVRFVRADKGTLLSPAQDRDTCWFGIGSHVAHKNFMPFFKAWEKELLKLDARPHWGKCFFTNPKELYPRFSDFLYLQKEFDPKGKFRSPYLDKLIKGKDADLAKVF